MNEFLSEISEMNDLFTYYSYLHREIREAWSAIICQHCDQLFDTVQVNCCKSQYQILCDKTSAKVEI